MQTRTRRSGRLALPILLALLGLAVVAGSSRAAAAPGDVVVLPATGIVDNVLANYIREGILRADREDAAAVVIRLNTPGGSLAATQEIVSTLLEAPLPVIVWVAPQGARAASAGTFITLAANLAYMAPGTNIGAATPVGGGGEDIEGAMGDKVRNDAIANMRSIAETRDRNVDWAVATITDARSSPASEAVAEGAVDGIARSLDDVLTAAHGQEVEVGGATRTLELEGASTRELPMNPLQGFLHLLSDPNIAFILFTIGFYGLLYEVISPNFVTGILGAIAIILAFIGFGSLPLNVAGLLLIGMAIILFILEFNVSSYGLLTIGGIVCFALGASALYTEPGTPAAPAIRVDPILVVGLTILTAMYMAVATVVVIRSRRRARLLGLAGGGLVGVSPGAYGYVRVPLQPSGIVHAGGEEWTARSADGRPVPTGTPVRVLRKDGLTLIVEPAEPHGELAHPTEAHP
jgi:membrane-bound serine protease (ClpP class)